MITPDKISSNSDQNSMNIFRKWVNFAKFCRKMRKSLTNIFWNIEVWAVQKHVNLVDLVKSFPTNIFLQNLASIQKRMSLIKFDHLAEKSESDSISNLSTKHVTPVVSSSTSGGTIKPLIPNSSDLELSQFNWSIFLASYSRIAFTDMASGARKIPEGQSLETRTLLPNR